MCKLQEPIDKLEMDIISQILSKYISQVLHMHTNLWVKHIRNLTSASALLYADRRLLHIHNYYSFEKSMEKMINIGFCRRSKKDVILCLYYCCYLYLICIPEYL